MFDLNFIWCNAVTYFSSHNVFSLLFAFYHIIMFNAKFSNTCYHSKSLEWQPSLIALKPRHILQLDMPTMANLHFIDRDENKGQTHYITLHSNEWITTNFKFHCLPLKLHINLNEKLTFKSIKNNQSLIMSYLQRVLQHSIFSTFYIWYGLIAVDVCYWDE